MEAVNKLQYPCKANVTYIGSESKNYNYAEYYFVDVYKTKIKSIDVFCVSIAGNKDTERKYTTEKLLLSEFKINNVIVDEEPTFSLIIEKNGNIQYKASDGASLASIISTLEIVKTSYVLQQLNPPK